MESQLSRKCVSEGAGKPQQPLTPFFVPSTTR